MRRLFLTLLLLLTCIIPSLAQGSYSGYVGHRFLLTCPSPPGNAAVNQTAWGSSGAHLKVEKSGTYSCYVTITEYFTGMEQVQCDYYYYWYDTYGRMHTNHATTYYTFTCKAVTVTPSPTSMTLDVGEGKSLDYSYSPSNVSPKPVITMQSQNTNVATVSNGYVRAVGAGTTYIVLYNNAGPDATCQVVVRNAEPTSVSLPSSLQAYVGESTTITPTVYPSNAQTQFTWYSRNPAIARVSSGGSVTGVEEGTARIYAVSSNGLQTNDCSVNVSYRAPSSIALSTSSYSLPISQTYTLKATVTPSNARYQLTWSSSREDVASVTQSGVVTAHKAGTTTITVRTDNGRSATCKITVPPNPSEISLPQKVAMTWGKTRRLKYTIIPSDAYASLSWSSTNSNVVRVDQNGLLTACGVGEADVKVQTQNGKEASCRVEVDAPAYVFTAWMRSEDAVSIGLEEYPRLGYADGKLLVETRSRRIEMDTAQVYKFTLDDKTTDRMPQEIQMESQLRLAYKDSHQLVATLLPAAYDIETQLTWKSSNPNVVSVSSAGLVKAIGPGDADVSVTASNGCQAICRVNVPEPSYYLFLWLRDGRYDSYAFADKPRISYADGEMNITSETGTYSYQHEQVWKVTLSDHETSFETGIEAISSQPLQSGINWPSPNEVRMEGMQAGEPLWVYSANGLLVKQYEASENGEVRIKLEDFIAGVYIIKSKTTTYKIIKK